MLYNFLGVTFQHGKLFGVTLALSQPMAERRMESDKTMQELQSDFRVAIQDYSAALQAQSNLLRIYFAANVAVIGFLGWSTFMIFRIKREVDHGAS
jgi:hypothetical protein